MASQTGGYDDRAGGIDYHVETLTVCLGCGRGMRGNEICLIRDGVGAYCYDCVLKGRSHEFYCYDCTRKEKWRPEL